MRKHLAISLALTVIFVASAFSQMSSQGEVVDIVDGRTVVVLIPTGKVKVELQYIDVPASGQPMHDMVREHLRRMLVGKLVNFRPRTFSAGRSIGRLMLDSVDVSQQLLRDGAAWHVPQQASGQEQQEFDEYAAMEAAAKSDKLGVWSIPGIRPAWEFKQAAAAANASPKTSTPLPKHAYAIDAGKRGTGYWSDKNPTLGNVGALTHGYNAATKTGYVSTSLMGITDVKNGPEERDYKAAMEIAYWYKENEGSGRTGYFLVTVISEGPQARFGADNDLVILAGEKKIPIGKAKRTVLNDDNLVREKLLYQVQRSSVESLVNSTVNLKINNYVIYPSGFAYSILYNMLQVSAPRAQTAKNQPPPKKAPRQ